MQIHSPAASNGWGYHGGSHSPPHPLLGERMWVRMHGAGAGERVVFVHVARRARWKSLGTDARRIGQPADR